MSGTGFWAVVQICAPPRKITANIPDELCHAARDDIDIESELSGGVELRVCQRPPPQNNQFDEIVCN